MNKEIEDALHMLLHCSLKDTEYETQVEQYKIVRKYITNLEQQNKKQKETIDDYEEDISNLLDIINKNCYELKCTSDEWLVIQKYQDKEVSE